MKTLFRKKFLHILLPFFCFLFPIFFFGFRETATSSSSLNELSDKLLRFHVIANSDSREDQAVKLKVKEAVLDLLSPSLSNARDKEEAKQIITSRMDEILTCSRNTLSQYGFSYSVEASITSCEFPIKSYGDLIFPSGTYEALRIVLGNGDGKNWWCVMYPPLCFVDASFGTVPEKSKEQLSSLLTEDTYETLQKSKQEATPPPIRFGIFTFLNDLFHLD